jgi:uncharacterized protein DUF429
MRSALTWIAGIDCATQPSRVGLALGALENDVLRLDAVVPCNRKTDVVARVASWMQSHSPLLLALDAPLGWPRPLAERLVTHRAGEYIDAEPDALFARASDHFIERRLKKKPFEVGASWIARTALSALKLLHQLRNRTGEQLPLLWEQGPPTRSGAIEVYPAATLKSYGWTQLVADNQNDEVVDKLALLEQRCGLGSLRSEVSGTGHFSMLRSAFWPVGTLWRSNAGRHLSHQMNATW